MSYLVLARKYRPQTFEAVVGQQQVVRTLTNAISGNRVAHAILFSGPRGTGKTTVARILAKAMNCAQGPTAAPCNACRSCREITEGRAADVFEIDGASNNSVDQVRELRDNVKYLPAHSPHKIYIIDEVHMLSTPAFNALLKTLEEPPDHVLFLFATTEPHKIPVTILSRCQRHEFKRIRLEQIVEHMRVLCETETYSISERGLTTIAREAGGSMRDALSLLDQVMACTEGAASDTEVLELLGVVDRKIIFDLSAALLQGRAPEVLGILDDLYDRGHDLKRLYGELAEHFRNLLVVKMGRSVERLVDLPTHEIRAVAEQVAAVSEDHLSQLLDLLLREEAVVKFSTQPKIALEMICIRLLQAKPALSIEVLIRQLEALRGEMTAVDSDRPQTAPENGQNGPLAGTDPGPASGAAAGGLHTATSPKAGCPCPAAATLRDPQTVWETLRSAISTRHPALAASLLKSRLRALDDNRLEIEVSGNGFNLAMISKDRNLEVIRNACRDVFAKEMELVITAEPTSGEENRPRSSDEHRLKGEAMSHPLVADALDIFDGRLIDVRIVKEEEDP